MARDLRYRPLRVALTASEEAAYFPFPFVRMAHDDARTKAGSAKDTTVLAESTDILMDQWKQQMAVVKNDILLHFDHTIEVVRREVLNENRDRIAILEDHYRDLERRVRRVERMLGIVP
jgi:hypothetical protein